MNEMDWLASVDPGAMLDFLGQRISPRKLRLFGCACCRRFWSQMSNMEARQAVETAERFAEGQETLEHLLEASEAVEPAIYEESYFHIPLFEAAALVAQENIQESIRLALARLLALVTREAVYGCVSIEEETQVAQPAVLAERTAQAACLREVVGNPFRPVEIDPAWLHWDEGCVANLARVMYDENRHDDLPILADALEEAGCSSMPLLDHLRLMQYGRSQMPQGIADHARGCWALDVLLGLS